MAKILLTDDDPHIVRVMHIWLERHGHKIVTARNGIEALQRIGRESIDMLISDMNMPELDGMGLAKSLRDSGRSDMPIIVLTARCDSEKLAKQMSQYGVTVFPKPFVPSKLVQEVDRVLGQSTQANASRPPRTTARETNDVRVACPAPALEGSE